MSWPKCGHMFFRVLVVEPHRAVCGQCGNEDWAAWLVRWLGLEFSRMVQGEDDWFFAPAPDLPKPDETEEADEARTEGGETAEVSEVPLGEHLDRSDDGNGRMP